MSPGLEKSHAVPSPLLQCSQMDKEMELTPEVKKVHKSNYMRAGCLAQDLVKSCEFSYLRHKCKWRRYGTCKDGL